MTEKPKIAVERKNEFVIDTTAVQTQIKMMIRDDVLKGVPQKQTNKKVKDTIRKFTKNISDAATRYQFESALAESFLKWYRQFSIGIRIARQIEGLGGILNNDLRKAGIIDKKETFGVKITTPVRNLVTDSEIGAPVIADYKNKVKSAYDKLIHELAMEDAKLPTGGTLRNVAEVRVRRQVNMDDLDALRAQGIEFIFISSHANCSKRCEPWQGRLYSLFGGTGTLDGYSYIPVETAMAGEKGDGNGILSGYNCRHRPIPYQRGLQPPMDFTEAEITYQRKIDKKQRQMETTIRKKKEEAFLLQGIHPEKSKKYFAAAKEKEIAYRKYSEEHGRAAYLYRTQVFRNEIEAKKKYVHSTQSVIPLTEGYQGIVPKNVPMEKIRLIEPVKAAEYLSKEFGGKPLQWKKKGGIINTENYKYDIHWFERNGQHYGEKTVSVKRWKK